MSATPPRPAAADFDPEVLRLFDQYVHGQVDRRGFLDRAARFVARSSEQADIAAVSDAGAGSATVGAAGPTGIGLPVRSAHRAVEGQQDDDQCRLSGPLVPWPTSAA